MSSQTAAQVPTVEWSTLDELIAFRFIQGLFQALGMTDPSLSIMDTDHLTEAGRRSQMSDRLEIIFPILLPLVDHRLHTERVSVLYILILVMF